MKVQVKQIQVSPIVSHVPYTSYINESVIAHGQGPPTQPINARAEIEAEKVAKELDKKERYEIYRDILLNKSQHKIHYRYGFYGAVSSIVLSVGLISIIAMIPVHDVLNENEDMSQYWYEVAIQALIGFLPACCGYMLLNCSYWTNIGFIKSWKKMKV